MAAIQKAFPGKMIVISEYGYCACTADRVGGDDPKGSTFFERTLRSSVEYDSVAGAIFFCYNDYRDPIGDQGLGVMKQRVHGVVDLYRRPQTFLRTAPSGIESG